MSVSPPTAPIALSYRRQFYQETLQSRDQTPGRPRQASGQPQGLVGREVANHSFLRALLKHGDATKIDFLLHEPADQLTLQATLDGVLPPSKQARISPIAAIDRWGREPGARVLWEPQPIDARWVWWRQRQHLSRNGATRIAMCGVTHTMSTPAAVRAMADLLRAPVQPFDTLICTSEAVRATAESLLNHHRWQSQLDPEPIRLRLETIPLGIDCDHHRPAKPIERTETRRRLGIPVDSRVILFVGRLSHHAKANPLPLFAACQTIASKSTQRIDLVMAGWFANEAIRRAFAEEASRCAPDVHIQFVDGRDASFRDSVWHAADVFVSLADSVQETFGLTVTEAISRGIPVIASDWNGYRDIIRHGQDGFLIPTQMLERGCDDAWFAMHEGRIRYDSFLASASQCVSLDFAALVKSLGLLAGDDELRSQFAASGRARAIECFAWPRIIARYEDLWSRMREKQDSSSPRERISGTGLNGQQTAVDTIAPPTQDTFRLYPSEWLNDSTMLRGRTPPPGEAGVDQDSPLANHAAHERLDRSSTAKLLAFANQTPTCTLASLVAKASVWQETIDPLATPDRVRRTVAWALKYGSLESNISLRRDNVDSDCRSPRPAMDLTYAVTCMGRLANLQQTLPALVAHGSGHVVVVDYSCPDHCGDWIEANFESRHVTVVRVHDKTLFDRSDAKNTAIAAANTQWVCVMDADIVIGDSFADHLRSRLQIGSFFRADNIGEGTGGTFVARRDDLERVGYHDPVYQGWGEEDDDLIEALQFAGLQARTFPSNAIRHLDHADELRTRFHSRMDRRITHMTNRLYRAAKWDLAKLNHTVPDLHTRQSLFQAIQDQVQHVVLKGQDGEVIVDAGRMNWVPLSAQCTRELRYRCSPDESIKPGPYCEPRDGKRSKGKGGGND